MTESGTITQHGLSFTYQFLVWDDEDSTAEDGVTFTATTPDKAAEKYAEDDQDCISEGCYNNGRRIGVRAPDGTITKWEVTVEWEPTFHSTLAEGK